MNEELPWQPMASRDLDREQSPPTTPADLQRGPATPGPGLRRPGGTGVQPPGAPGPEPDGPGPHGGDSHHPGDGTERLGDQAHVLAEEGQLELEMPGAGEMIKGHPDGICRHP